MQKHVQIIASVLMLFEVAIVHAADCQPLSVTYLQSGFGEMTTDDSNVWSWYNKYSCAYASRSGGAEGNLFTPSLNLSGADAVTISFTHAHRFATNLETELTLWVTDDFKGSYEASSWHKLAITPYASNTSWTFVDALVNVPISYVGDNTVFCFKYISTSSGYATWEVKNLNISSTCQGKSVSPVALPNVGDGRLKVCAQNLQNYYYNLNTGRGNYTPEERAAKTRKIVDAMLWVDADIYAFCELEAQPVILKQLADSVNARVEGSPYVAVEDDIDEEWDATYNNNLKSGFIYRSDRVKTVGQNIPATTAYYYKNVLRVQAFEELASHERFILSMNHFKAKDNSEDASNSKRVTNANQLVQGLNAYSLDPDILIVGDLNCEVGEDPLTIIENAGYTEQLLKYNPSAYSHCYNGGELIDHVYANASMAEQITGAGVFHISTSCGADGSLNTGHRYSDHDPYVVGINLLPTNATSCEPMEMSYLRTGGSGLGEMMSINVSGQYHWRYQSSYGATCQDKGGEDWLCTPTYDLSTASSVTLAFDHAINYANTMSDEQTLWVTKDYVSVGESEWTQLTIPTYPSGTNWTFVNTTIEVPLEAVGTRTAFAFKYAVSANAAKDPTWEIKNLKVQVGCDETEYALPSAEESSLVRKWIQDGHLYILQPDGSCYNIMGVKVR